MMPVGRKRTNHCGQSLGVWCRAAPPCASVSAGSSARGSSPLEAPTRQCPGWTPGVPRAQTWAAR
eukprot:361082-Chlamydomonas_euryale.AAC.14